MQVEGGNVENLVSLVNLFLFLFFSSFNLTYGNNIKDMKWCVLIEFGWKGMLRVLPYFALPLHGRYKPNQTMLISGLLLKPANVWYRYIVIVVDSWLTLNMHRAVIVRSNQPNGSTKGEKNINNFKKNLCRSIIHSSQPKILGWSLGILFFLANLVISFCQIGQDNRRQSRLSSSVKQPLI